MFALIHKLLHTKKLKAVSSERNFEPSKGSSHLGERHKNLLWLLNSFLLPCEQVALDQAQKNSTTHTYKRGIFIFLLTEAIRPSKHTGDFGSVFSAQGCRDLRCYKIFGFAGLPPLLAQNLVLSQDWIPHFLEL